MWRPGPWRSSTSSGRPIMPVDSLPRSPHALQKRTALARALMAEPHLLLLDEPASGLSESEMDALGSRIRTLTEGMSVLLVEHHMDLVMSICDRIVVLNFGEVIASGPPDAIRDDPAVVGAYLGDEVHDRGQAGHPEEPGA